MIIHLSYYDLLPLRAVAALREKILQEQSSLDINLTEVRDPYTL
jgi:hypothetical protein